MTPDDLEQKIRVAFPDLSHVVRPPWLQSVGQQLTPFSANSKSSISQVRPHADAQRIG